MVRFPKAVTVFVAGILTFVLLQIGCAVSAFAASSPSDLKLRQVYIDYPSMTLFADLTDSAGNRILPAESDNMAVMVGGTSAKIKNMSPFSRSGEGITTIFLIDVSSSIKPARFEELKKTVSAWIKKMGANDRAAIVSFGDSVKVVEEFTGEPKVLLYSLQTLRATGKHTQLNSGLLRAIDLARIKSSELPKRKMILLCTDGIDDAPGGATIEEVRESIKNDPVPIYSMFFDAQKMSAADRKNAMTALGEFSRRSGGTFHDVKTSSFSKTFASIEKALGGTLVIEADLEGLAMDGSVKRLSVVFESAKVRLSDGIDSRFENYVGDSGAASQEEASEAPAEGGDSENEAVVENEVVVEGTVSSDESGSAAISEGESGSTTVSGGESEKQEKPATFLVKLKENRLYVVAGIAAVLLLAVVIVVINKKKAQKNIPASKKIPSDESTVTESVPSAPTAASDAAQQVNNSPEYTAVSAAAPQINNTPEYAAQVAPPPLPKTPTLNVELTVIGTAANACVYKVPVADRAVIGRSTGGKGVDIQGDGTISSRHCEFIFAQGKLFVLDLNSTNGTLLNGVPTHGTTPVNNEDRLMLGKTEFRVRIKGS